MKKKIIMLLIIMIGIVIMPNNVKAATKSLNLKEALEDESFTLTANNYKETSDQITIYLFRGKGCGYCRAFLEFLNEISTEYGKYFKLVSYEVWNNQENSKLYGDVATFLGKDASGVPFIVIGDQVFNGYAEGYNDSIKQAIMDLYNTSKKKRYDVFTEMEKNNKKEISYDNPLIIYLVCTLISTLVIISFVNLRYNELKQEIYSLKDINKKDYKHNKKGDK